MDKAGQPAGFILAVRRKTPVFGTDLEPESGWVTIFFVKPSLRGAGLGKILLYETLDLMRQRGSHGAWFLWTGEESPAGKLYRRAGFTITRRFNVMKKTL